MSHDSHASSASDPCMSVTCRHAGRTATLAPGASQTLHFAVTDDAVALVDWAGSHRAFAGEYVCSADEAVAFKTGIDPEGSAIITRVFVFKCSFIRVTCLCSSPALLRQLRNRVSYRRVAGGEARGCHGVLCCDHHHVEHAAASAATPPRRQTMSAVLARHERLARRIGTTNAAGNDPSPARAPGDSAWRRQRGAN